jgi:hypothetical protein
MKRLLGVATLACLIVGSLAASASAQTEPPPPPAGGGGGGGSSYSGGRGTIGVGGIEYLSGLAGLSVAFDPGPWHLDTELAFSGGNGANSTVLVGGRFWYHLKAGANADLSAGAGLAYQRVNPPGPPAAATAILIEGGILIRIFLTTNVALGASTGLVIGTNDANFYNIGATNVVGAASLHYFF